MVHYGPGVDSTSNRSEYQGYLVEAKRLLVRRADNLATFMCRLSSNPGNLNVLGAQRACSVLYRDTLTFYLLP